MDLPESPAGWGADDITSFIDNVRLNCFATYANLRQEYAKLAEVDTLFRRLVENLINTSDWFAAFFLLRAHSAFLAGTHLAMAGQTAETYASLRLCLENALYGLYLARNPDSRETWLRRHDCEQATAVLGSSSRLVTCSTRYVALMGERQKSRESFMSTVSITGRIQTSAC